MILRIEWQDFHKYSISWNRRSDIFRATRIKITSSRFVGAHNMPYPRDCPQGQSIALANYHRQPPARPSPNARHDHTVWWMLRRLLPRLTGRLGRPALRFFSLSIGEALLYGDCAVFSLSTKRRPTCRHHRLRFLQNGADFQHAGQRLVFKDRRAITAPSS